MWLSILRIVAESRVCLFLDISKYKWKAYKMISFMNVFTLSMTFKFFFVVFHFRADQKTKMQTKLEMKFIYKKLHAFHERSEMEWNKMNATWCPLRNVMESIKWSDLLRYNAIQEVTATTSLPSVRELLV